MTDSRDEAKQVQPNREAFWRALIPRLLAGDKDAWDEIAADLCPKLLKSARFLFREKDVLEPDASDLASDVATRVLCDALPRMLPDLKPERGCDAYLFRRMRWVARDTLKKWKRRRRKENQAGNIDVEDIDVGNGMSEESERTESKLFFLGHSLFLLSNEELRMLRLQAIEGKSATEIARIVGKKVPAVSTALKRIRRITRREMGRQEQDEYRS
jgi:RNA polymerase sigma factor (sigma-70 family)